MNLDTILKNMDAQEGQTKVAAETEPQGAAESKALQTALNKVAGSAPSNEPKVDDNPLNGLMKMAQSIAGTEEEREVALAYQCGSAFADAAVAKFAAYDAEARVEMAKQAAESKPAMAEATFKAAPTVDVYTIKKIASETVVETLERMAAAQEQQAPTTLQQKVAAEYDQGWDAALQETFNAAASEFYKGAMEAQIVVENLRQASPQ